MQIDVERRDIVGQAAPVPHAPPDHARERGGRVTRLEHGDFERAILARHALAHEQLGRALEIAAARGIGPLALHPATHEPGLARAARAGPALVGQLDSAPQAGVEDLLAWLTVKILGEIPGPAPGGDDDPHGALGPPRPVAFQRPADDNPCRPESSREFLPEPPIFYRGKRPAQ
jgi:hypothetical protein